MKFYISDLGLIALAIFYLPLVLWALWRIARSPQLSAIKRNIALVAALVLAYAIPLGDVTINSIAMNEACKKAGLHVYKKVAVEGYLDSSAGRLLLDQHYEQHPYRFLEQPDAKGKIHHHERQPNGLVLTSILDQPVAEYEVIYEDGTGARYGGVGNYSRAFVRNRLSGEVLGEWLTFGPRHGWIDRMTLVRWFGQGLPGCSGKVLEIYPHWRQEILPPKNIAR